MSVRDDGALAWSVNQTFMNGNAMNYTYGMYKTTKWAADIDAYYRVKPYSDDRRV
jgi:hypothetical protein